MGKVAAYWDVVNLTPLTGHTTFGTPRIALGYQYLFVVLSYIVLFNNTVSEDSNNLIPTWHLSRIFTPDKKPALITLMTPLSSHLIRITKQNSIQLFKHLLLLSMSIRRCKKSGTDFPYFKAQNSTLFGSGIANASVVLVPEQTVVHLTLMQTSTRFSLIVHGLNQVFQASGSTVNYFLEGP